MVSCDPFFSSVQLLVYGNSNAGSTAFTDSSQNAFALTNSGTTQATAANPLFGMNTITAGNSTVNTPNIVASGPLDLGESNIWTVEGWHFPTASNIFIGGGNQPTTGFSLEKLPTLVQATLQTPGGNRTFQGPAMTNNVWNHFALVNNKGTVVLYINGVGGTGVSTSVGLSWSGAPFTLGGNDGAFMAGQLAEARVTNGVARYTANFTPPAAAFPNINCTQSVPNLVGQTYASALAANSAAGYVTTVQESNHPTIPAGLVISQLPPAGTLSILGTNVIITFSTGPVTTAGMGGDVWGSTGGGQISSQSPEPVGQALAYGTQQNNAVVQGNQSVLAALANGQLIPQTGAPITQNTPAASVPTTPAMG
jgi:hypothetical protein